MMLISSARSSCGFLGIQFSDIYIYIYIYITCVAIIAHCLTAWCFLSAFGVGSVETATWSTQNDGLPATADRLVVNVAQPEGGTDIGDRRESQQEERENDDCAPLSPIGNDRAVRSKVRFVVRVGVV